MVTEVARTRETVDGIRETLQANPRGSGSDGALLDTKALAVLAGFWQQVRDLEAEGVLSTTQADALVASVDAISNAISSADAATLGGETPFARAVTDAAAFGLAPPFRNPTEERATVAFTVEEATDVRLSVYDALGREVAVLMEGSVPGGRHKARFDGAELVAGTYLVRLTTTAGPVATHRLTLLR